MSDRLLIPKKPHCFHQEDCPVVIEAVIKQDRETARMVSEEIFEEIEGHLKHVIYLHSQSNFQSTMKIAEERILDKIQALKDKYLKEMNNG